jgi:uncharacterized damage-inducible protein DinB
MNIQSADDIYASNSEIRRGFFTLLDSITDDEAVTLPPGQTWTIQQIVEHVAMVDTGSANICGKLLQGAKEAGVPSNGKISVSADFGQKAEEIRDMKVEAPERVHPTGEVSIEAARQKMVDNEITFNAFRSDLAQFELQEHTFPHPYLGKLTAAEWLMIAGGHERRHMDQIKRILVEFRNKKPRSEGG